MAREPTGAPVHLRPHAQVAERVLLPGDPGRALRLAQVLTSKPMMLNHNRGLWGYTGTAADGLPLTIQSAGIGGPSAAVIVEELIGLGARRLVRIGTCRHPGSAPGTLLAGDPVSGAGTFAGAPSDPELLAALDAPRVGVESLDAYYEGGADASHAWDMESAAVLTVAARFGAAAACLLLVVDSLDVDAVHAAELELGRVAFAALG